MDKSQGGNWDDIIRIKAKQDEEMMKIEKEQALKSKVVYKKELDSLQFLKSLEKDEQAKLKNSDLETIKLKQKNFELERMIAKEEEARKKSEFAEVLASHKSAQDQKKEIEKNLLEQEHRNYLNRIQERIEEDKREKVARREFEYKSNQEFKEFAANQRQLREKEKRNEMELEKNLIRERQMLDEKREQEQRAFFQMLKDKQKRNEMIFNEKVAPSKFEREMLINQWIDRGVEDNMRRQAIVEKKEKEKKNEAIKASKQSFNNFLEMKERLRLDNMAYKQREIEEGLRKNLQYKEEEQKRRDIEFQRKKEYFSSLRDQNERYSKNIGKDNELSEFEKKLNRVYLSESSIKPRFQFQGNSIIGSPTAKIGLESKQEIYKSSMSPNRFNKGTLLW